MNIVLINDSNIDIGDCERTLRRLGHSVVETCAAAKSFYHAVVAKAPDLILVRVNKVDDRILNNIYLLQRQKPLPVLLFAEQSAVADVNNVLTAGVSAYVVDGYDAERIPALIEVAKARFRQIKQLCDELLEAQQSLQDRRVIEKAKGIIMDKQGLSEEQAYMLLRKAAMNQSKKIV